MLRYLGKSLYFPSNDPLVQVRDAIPKHGNYSNCGAYVCKYMDYTLRGYNLSTSIWDGADVEVFRYRTAKELQKMIDRRIPRYFTR